MASYNRTMQILDLRVPKAQIHVYSCESAHISKLIGQRLSLWPRVCAGCTVRSGYFILHIFVFQYELLAVVPTERVYEFRKVEFEFIWLPWYNYIYEETMYD